ncbi:MAG: ArnT family glycosyltransferase [Chloroflexota bacterium]
MSNPSLPKPTFAGALDTGRLATIRASLLPLGLVALALALRWDRLAYATFRGDQAWSLGRAFDFVFRGDFPLVGIRSSVGSAQGPLEIYLLAIPVALSGGDPVVATAFVGLLQTAAVVVTYYFAGRYFGRGVGLLAAFLYAVNPWAIYFGQRVWTQDMLPLFAALYYTCLFAAVVGRRRYCFAAACALLVALFMLHPATIILWPLTLLVLLLFWRRLGWRPLLLGTVLGAGVAAPYLYYEAQNGFPNFNLYAGLLGQGGVFSLLPLDLVTTLASARYFPMLLGGTYRGEWHLPDLAVQNAATAGLMYLGLGVCLWKVGSARRRRSPAGEREKYLLLFLCFWVPVLTVTRSSVGFQISHLLDLYPLPFVLVAVAASEGTALIAGVASRWRGDRRLMGALALALVALWLAVPQVLYFRHSLDYLERNGPRGQHGVPLVDAQRAVAVARELRPTTGAPVYFVGARSQWQALSYLGRDLDVRLVDPLVAGLRPADATSGAVALLAADDELATLQIVDPDGPKARRLRGLGFVEAPERAVRGPDGYVYFRAYVLPTARRAGDLPPGFVRPTRPASLPGGLRLVGYAAAPASPAEKAGLTLLWQVPAGLEAKRDTNDAFVVFAHMVEGGGRVVGNDEVDLFTYEAWRGGDLLATFYAYDLPPDVGPALLWFDLGAYTRLERRPLAWDDGASALKVGPLKVAPAAPSVAPALATAFRFGDALGLSGYDSERASGAAGERLDVALRWQALAAPGAAYTVSLQLLDGAGRLVAQHDGQPVGGQYPTSAWATGETVRDAHAIALPAGLPAGEYTLSVVVYDPATNARLPVAGPGAAPAGERAVLGKVSLP